MNLILTGSTALDYRLGGRLDRAPVDLDFVATYDDFSTYVKHLKHLGEKVTACYPINDGKTYVVKATDVNGDSCIYECEIAWADSSAEELIQTAMSDPETMDVGNWKLPSLDFLYALKMSHRYKKDSPHFLKTMRDIQLMRNNGAILQPCHLNFFKSRVKATYNYKHPNLNVSKDSFFKGDEVPYVYDHDSLHLAVKHLEFPAYSYLKKDGAEVAICRDKFFAADELLRLYTVLEEVQVLSLERAILAYPDTDVRKAFNLAHMKITTSISSGWWREWAWEHYDVVQAMYEDDYVDKFKQALADGIVLPFKQENTYGN